MPQWDPRKRTQRPADASSPRASSPVMKRQKATEGTNCSCPKCKRRQRHIPPITDGNFEEEWRKFEKDREDSESENLKASKPFLIYAAMNKKQALAAALARHSTGTKTKWFRSSVFERAHEEGR